MLAKFVGIVFALVVPLGAQQVVALKVKELHVGNGDVIAPCVVLIRGGKIHAIGKDLAVPQGAVVHDFSESVAMPGMVDGVSHAGLARGAAENEESREVTPEIDALLAFDRASDTIQRVRRTGVTTLAIQPGTRNIIGGAPVVLKPGARGEIPKVLAEGQAITITLGLDPTFGNRGPTDGPSGLFTRRPRSRMGVIYEIRDAFQKAKAARGADASAAGADPAAARLLDAMDGKITVYWLARAAKDVVTALRLAKEFGITRNVILEGHEAGDVVDELHAAAVPVLLGPMFHPQYRGGRGRGGMEDFPLPWPVPGEPHPDHDPMAAEREQERLERGIDVPFNAREEALFGDSGDACCAGLGTGAGGQEEERPTTFTAQALWKSKVRLGLAAGGTRPGETLLDMARFSVRGGLAKERAIPMLTSIPASILGVAARVGTIEAGKDADLVVFDGDPLLPTSGVRIVIQDGEVAYDAANSNPQKERPQ